MKKHEKNREKQRKKNNAKIGWRTLFRGGFINNFRKIGLLFSGSIIIQPEHCIFIYICMSI